MSGRLKIIDAMETLSIKDRRTFVVWCQRHDVTIAKDTGGTFVFEQEFYFKIKSIEDEAMSKKYGADWCNKLMIVETVKQNTSCERILKPDSTIQGYYKPISEMAKQFGGRGKL